MNAPAPFSRLGEHLLLELPSARVVFTTRRGGHSTGPFQSLNLGAMTDDDPELVARNRATLRRDLGAPPVSFVHQVHGSEVRTITAATPDPTQPPQVDAQVTDRRDLGLATLTADCLPIAVVGNSAVGMLHAGWRGLAAGIVAATVQAVRELDPDTERFVGVIGPGAGRCCYEVGDEVRHALRAYPQAGQESHMDLKAIAAAQLGQADVTTVHDVGLCTICSDPEMLFSHRRDRGVTGRQAGLVWLR